MQILYKIQITGLCLKKIHNVVYICTSRYKLYLHKIQTVYVHLYKANTNYAFAQAYTSYLFVQVDTNS